MAAAAGASGASAAAASGGGGGGATAAAAYGAGGDPVPTPWRGGGVSRWGDVEEEDEALAVRHSLVFDYGRTFVHAGLCARDWVFGDDEEDDGEAERASASIRMRPEVTREVSVVRPRMAPVVVGMGQRDCAVGEHDWLEPWRGPGVMAGRIQKPVVCGKIENADDWERVMHRCIYNELRRAPEEYAAVVSASLPQVQQLLRRNRSASYTFPDVCKVTQTMFEVFNMRAVAIVPRPEAIASYLGLSAATLVDIGADSTSIVCIDASGEVLYDTAVVRAGLGVDGVADRLEASLPDDWREPYAGRFRQMAGNGVCAQALASEHAMCSPVPPGHPDAPPPPSDVLAALPQEYVVSGVELPTVRLPGPMLQQVVEYVFWGGGSELPTLDAEVVSCACDQKNDFLRNVVLVGGGARIPGMAARLQHALRETHNVAAATVTVAEAPELVSYRALMDVAHRLRGIPFSESETNGDAIDSKHSYLPETAPGLQAGWYPQAIYDELGPDRVPLVRVNKIPSGSASRVKAARA